MQVAAMRLQLHEFEHRRRLQDVIGALGYIFGLAGVAFYVLGRRKSTDVEASTESPPGPTDGNST